MTAHPEPVRPFFLPVGSRKIFCLHHVARDVPRGAVVYVPPFAEEMNKSRRMVALQARSLAAEGWHVLQFDFEGTGDSEGDFSEASWAGWLEDIAASRAWLAGQTGHDPWLWGLRLGGLLAAVSVKQCSAPGLVLWQPVLSGRQHLQQFLRLKAGAEWLAAGREAETSTKPMELLQAGNPVEVAGYRVNPALALPMAEASLEMPTGLPRLAWFEISPREGSGLAPASERVVGRQRNSPGLHLEVIKGSSFWQALEIETVPELITATSAVLSQMPNELGMRFRCNDEWLVGVLSLPTGEPKDIGVVVVVGGPQYRVGSHRQFVLLARRLAQAGYAVLRFGVRGMGDSTGEFQGFEALRPDIEASIHALMGEVTAVRRVVLWGLCDAASAVLMDAASLPNLASLVLLNPWVRHVDTEARTQIKRYYGQRLLEPDFWRKLLAGQVKVGKALNELASKLWLILRSSNRAVEATLDFRDRMAKGALESGLPQFYILSGRDHVSAEFIEYSRLHPRLRKVWQLKAIERLDLPSADHTFSSNEHRAQVEVATLDWLDRMSGRTPR